MGTTVVVAPGEGDMLWFGGGLLTLKVTSEQSDGAFLLFEDTAVRGKTTPLHVHPGHDESFFVIEGELLFHSDGAEHRGGAGAVVAIPRGTPHAFLVTSETARFFVVVTPGSAEAEAFFREGGEPAPEPVAPPPGSLDIERLVAAGKRTGAMDVLGPPPFAQVARTAV